MQKFIVLICLAFLSFAASGQSVVQLRGDTIKAYKSGGFAEFVLQSKTKDSLGFLINLGNGLTSFVKPYKVGDSVFIGPIHFPVGSTPPPEDDNLDTILRRAGQLSANRGTTLNGFNWNFTGIGALIFNDPVNEIFKQTSDVTFMQIYQPGNYNGTDRNRFASWLDSTVYDVTYPADVIGSPWSYNYNPGGSRIIGSDVAWAYKTETHYFNLTEFHWPEFIGANNVTHRLWSMYVNRADGKNDLQAEFEDMKVWSNASGHSGDPFFGVLHNADAEVIFLQPSGVGANIAAKITFNNSTGIGNVGISHPADGGGLFLDAYYEGLFLNTQLVHAPPVLLFDQTGFGSTPYNVDMYGDNTSGKGFKFKAGGTDAAFITDLSASFSGIVAANNYLYTPYFLSTKDIVMYQALLTDYAEYSSTVTLLNTNYYVNFTSGTFTATIPTANYSLVYTGGPSAGFSRDFYLKNSGVGIITLDPVGSETINGSATYSLTAGSSVHLKSNKVSNWVTYP